MRGDGLKIAPDRLDFIEFGGVFRQPLDGEPVCAGGQGGERAFAGVDRTIVLDQRMVKTLPSAGSAVLNSALARGNERIVGDIDLIELNVMTGRVERLFVFAYAMVRRLERGNGPIEGLPALVQQLVCGKATPNQRTGTVELLLRESSVAFSADPHWRAPRGGCGEPVRLEPRPF